MTIVSNTGPLIALAKVDRLDLVERLFGQVRVPPAVQRELLAIQSPEVTRLEQALTHLIELVPVPRLTPEVQIVTMQLGAGEQQAIALAYELKLPLLIDDHRGRSAARRLGLMVIGVAGALIQAKKAGSLSAVRPLLEEIRERGYWLSDELLDVATKLAGEDIDSR